MTVHLHEMRPKLPFSRLHRDSLQTVRLTAEMMNQSFVKKAGTQVGAPVSQQRFEVMDQIITLFIPRMPS